MMCLDESCEKIIIVYVITLKNYEKEEEEEVMFAQRINVKENSILYGQGKTKNLHLSFKIVWWPYGATRMEKNIKSDKCCTYL